jgi:hypothetical protein
MGKIKEYNMENKEVYKFIFYLDQNNKSLDDKLLYRTIKVVASSVQEAIKLSEDSSIFKHPYNPDEEVIRAITEVSNPDNPVVLDLTTI